MGQYHEALEYISRCKEKLKEQQPPVEETEKEEKKEKKSAAPKVWTF